MYSLAVLRCAFITTVPRVGLQCVIVIIPDVLTCSFEVRILSPSPWYTKTPHIYWVLWYLIGLWLTSLDTK